MSALCPWQRLREPVAAADATLAEPLAAGSCDHVHGPALPHPARAAPACELGRHPTPFCSSQSDLSRSSDLQPRAGGWAFLGPFAPGSPGGRGRGGLRGSPRGACAQPMTSHRPPDRSPHREPPGLGNKRGGGPPREGQEDRLRSSLVRNSSHCPTGPGELVLGVRLGGHFQQRKRGHRNLGWGLGGSPCGLGDELVACGTPDSPPLTSLPHSSFSR